MKVVKKIVTFPIIIVLSVISWMIDLIIKSECWVAGVGVLLLAILAMLAIIKHQWLQVGLFAGIAGTVIVILFLSAYILAWLENVLKMLK